MSANPSPEALEATLSELAHLLIKPARLTFKRKEAGLGAGGYGDVRLATLNTSFKSKRKVAVKQLRMVEDGVVSHRIAFRLARELKVWAQLKHPNILELLGYYLSKNYEHAQFVSAFMVNGNVMQYIRRVHVGVAVRLKFVRDIAAGLTYLHDLRPPVCHGDLKPANVLVNDDLDAVLCDFGLSAFIHESNAASGLTTSESTKGTFPYMSPELIIEEESKHTLQSDVWAWGCTAFEILTEMAPYSYSTRTDFPAIFREMSKKSAPGSIGSLSKLIPGTDADPACHTGMSSLLSIIPQCWDFDATQRPAAATILRSIPISSKARALLKGEAMRFWSIRDTLEATFAELAHLLVIPARLTLEEAELGVGGFGEMYLATLDKSSEFQRKVAVKQLRIVHVQVWEDRQRIALRLVTELKVWAKVKHPNILELIGYYLSGDYACAQLVSDFMANGNVMQYIQRNHVSAAVRLKFVQDIAAGLTYLHDFSPLMCHGDLKPANVLVTEGLDAVLCDFGVSSFIHESDKAPGIINSKSMKGSPRYMSPEHILQDPQYALQSDVWAWGCTAFEIMTEIIPYSETKNPLDILMEMCLRSAPGPIDALKPLILGTGVDPTCLTGVSALRSIIPQCWDIDPTQRPAASRILECISIPPKTEVRLAASEDQGGIPSPHPGDHSGHGGVASQEQTYVAPGRAGALCMNCQQYPKVPGQDCCSKACLDNGSSRLSASAENDALSQRVAVSNFSNLSSPVTAKHNTPHSMRAGFYLSTAESTRLSKERQPMSQGNGVSFKDQEDNPQAVAETTFKLHQQTASAPGKAADKDTATNPTTSGNSYLGEGLQNISQAKRSDANQATPSRRKPKQNEDSGTRTSPFNTLALGASEDSQPSIFKKILSIGRFRLPKSHRYPSAPTDPGKKAPLKLDDLKDLSASGSRSGRFKAWDRTGQLTERTKPKFTGFFSDVSQAKLGNLVVAVKTLRVAAEMESPESRIWPWLAREIYVCATLDHPNVLEFLGFTFEDGKPCLISPWCENGTLQEYLQKFPDANRRWLVREIAEGLRHLHVQTPPIIHGDLKTTNVFVTGDCVAKISDFGGSRRYQCSMGLLVTSIRYSAPEILRDGQHSTLCSDVFSFACVALETMTDKCPWYKIRNVVGAITEVVFKKQTPSPEDHPGMEEAIWELLRRCWSYEPSDRPHMVEVCKMLF